MINQLLFNLKAAWRISPFTVIAFAIADALLLILIGSMLFRMLE